MSSPTTSISDRVAEPGATIKKISIGQGEETRSQNGDIEKSPVDVAAAENQSESMCVDWASATDPENPHNWTVAKKIFHIVGATAMNLVVIMGSAIYFPAYLEVSEHFHIGRTAAILPFSTYILGLSFGPMITAPISETKGRHFVYTITIPIYALFVLGCALAPNFAALVVLRFFAGLFGSPPLAVAAGTVADLYKEEDRCKPIAGICMVGVAGSGLGIIVGSYAAGGKGWRWTQWALLFLIIASYVFVLLMKETYKKTILQTRARRLGITLPQTGPKGAAALKLIITVTLTTPILMLCTEPIVILLSLYIACNFATVYCFFVAFPIVFTTQYGFTSEQDGLPFFSVVVGACIGSAISILSDRFLYQPHVRAAKDPQSNVKVVPEMRLYGAMIGCFLPPIGLFWFAWSARPSISWASPVIATIPIAAGFNAVFISVALYLVDAYESLLGASAMAANGILRYVLGGVFPLFTAQMFASLGIGWAGSILGFISCAMMPLPWIIWKWGAAIRKRSKYGSVGM